ncbi:MAG: hypothetical protein ABGX47_26275 [Martelella sp.]|uniref:hypothetical protein n=1 Tax=Martelella sp. TaxID=1969699 RepID=UPI003241D4F0
MLKQTFQYIAREWLALLLITAFLAYLPYLAEIVLGSDTSTGTGTSIGMLIVFYFIQRSLLQNVRFASSNNGGTQRSKGMLIFSAKAFFLLIVSFIPSLTLIILAVNTLEKNAAYLVAFLAAPVWYFISSFVFALVGTWLPATIEGQEASIGAAFARGKKSFFQLLWRFIVFLFAPGTIYLFGAFLVLSYFVESEYSAIALALAFLSTAVNMYMLVFLSVALVSAYRGNESPEQAVVSHGAPEAS